MKPITNLFLRFTFLLFFLLSANGKLAAQTINNAPFVALTNYKVLPDANYTFARVINEHSKGFTNNLSKPITTRYYWVKIELHNPYPNQENYVLRFPNTTLYTLYYRTKKGWVHRSAGLEVADGRRLAGTIPFEILPNTTSALYLKVDLGETVLKTELKPEISIEKQIVYNAHEQIALFSYLLCCVALVCFLCYNLYLYFHLKDKVYNHYVTIQVGALLYLTGVEHFFNVIIPLRIVYLNVWHDGFTRVFNINTFFMHVGVVLIFGGLCQFTRAYLRTGKFMPGVDRVLHLLPIIYLVVEAITIISAATRLYFYFIIAANILTLAIIATCLTSGVLAYKQKVSSAKHFLAAITLPTAIAALVSINNILYGMPNPLLPAIAILSQIVTFAVALVARVKEINNNLNLRAIEAVKLEAANAAAEHRQLAIEQENEIITLSIALEKERNAHLQQTLEANQRELVGNSVYLQQKNKLLADLTKQLQDINHLNPDNNTHALRDIQSSLKNNMRLDEEWSKFKLHFEQVHPDFFKNLRSSYPNLTQYELRLCAYFHINLTTKEIASLLNIAPTSVRQAKTRLYKKMKM